MELRYERLTRPVLQDPTDVSDDKKLIHMRTLLQSLPMNRYPAANMLVTMKEEADANVPATITDPQHHRRTNEATHSQPSSSAYQ